MASVAELRVHEMERRSFEDTLRWQLLRLPWIHELEPKPGAVKESASLLHLLGNGDVEGLERVGLGL